MLGKIVRLTLNGSAEKVKAVKNDQEVIEAIGMPDAIGGSGIMVLIYKFSGDAQLSIGVSGDLPTSTVFYIKRFDVRHVEISNDRDRQ